MDRHALAQALNRTMMAHAPGWTDHNDRDPGVTMLEVIAYLGDSLRNLHGFGTVSGLQVEVDANGETIAIAPGLAIDAHGREVQLNEEVTLTMPAATSSPTLVLVEYVERYVDPVPASDGTEASRVEEGCRISLGADPGESGVAIARLVRETAGWRVDRSFVPPRVE